MNISYHPYQLQYNENYGTLDSARVRQGALLKIDFHDGLTGYCDCHPWEELGDLSVQNQLALLKQNDTTPLLDCSLRFARLDAEARQDHRSLFDGIQIPPSHQIVSLSDDIKKLAEIGITHFKLKLGTQIEKEILTLKSWVEIVPGLKLRPDFNERLSRESFIDYWDKIPFTVKQKIDYIEDPYPYDPIYWSEDQIQLNVSFAADHQAFKALQHSKSAQYIVHKPAVEKPPSLTDSKTQLVITTYLDHPLGQMCAAYTAAKLKAIYPNQVNLCGLLSHKCYQNDPFVHAIHSVGQQLTSPGGTGFGFDTLLKELQWKSL